MKPFYKDEDAIERQKGYAGKNMAEITELERKVFEGNKLKVDDAHAKYASDRKSMLTVQRLIDYLKTQDPDACVLAYEPNSDAYIEQFPSLPSPDILNVAEAKKKMQEDLANWYKNSPDASNKIERDISTVFRYAKDNDVIIRFT